MTTKTQTNPSANDSVGGCPCSDCRCVECRCGSAGACACPRTSAAE